MLKEFYMIFMVMFLSLFSNAQTWECSYSDKQIGSMLLVPKEAICFDTVPYMCLDTIVTRAYFEMRDMMHGHVPYDLKRLEYLIEYSYLDGRLDYREFCKPFDEIVKVLTKFIEANDLQKYTTAPNYALFEYFFTPSIMNGNKTLAYDFEDPMGVYDYTKKFASKVIETHSGQCWSMSIAYKIICDALGGDSHLTYSPMHAYIKHIGEDGKWVGINLVNGAPVTDKWIIMTSHISAESIVNGIFLRPTSDNELVSQMLIELACMYQRKYQRYDSFTLLCAETVLTKYPKNIIALIVKGNTHREFALNFISRYGYRHSHFLEKNLQCYKETYDLIDNLGYTTYTEEEYNQWVSDALKQLESQR